MREHYDQLIQGIKHKVLRMGSMVENIIDSSVRALQEQDMEAAKKVYVDDDKIDDMEHEIEKDCIKLLALQQPLAKDLRIVTTALKIITDLERMGDHAVNIAKVTIEIGKQPLMKPLIDIPKMTSMVQEMVKLSLDAFVKEDIELARKSALMDENVDEIYEGVMKELLGMVSRNEGFINQCTRLLFVARYLERIADHTTNICERIIYMITGEFEEIN